MDVIIGPDPVADTDGLIERAVGWRCGTAVSVDRVPNTPADPDIAQWSAAYGPADDRVPAGGAALDDRSARHAAIGELLERYAAAAQPIPITDRAAISTDERILDHRDFTLHSPEQQQRPDFPHRASYQRADRSVMHSLLDNESVWVPTNLLSNDPRLGHLATSNGLAAGPTTLTALLRGTQELIERDALMITWLHQVGARRVPAPDCVVQVAEPIGAEVVVFDLTPDFSPHPVVAVAGTATLSGRPRNGFGLACRADFEQAAAKAVLEWAQGVSFAGVNSAADEPQDACVEADQVRDFDQHAVFYTRRPDLWQRLPIWSGPIGRPPAPRSPASRSSAPRSSAPRSSAPRSTAELEDLVRALAASGVELFYRDLTTPDLAACGVRAVRVVSPQLVPIHSDHRWPHLGGSTSDLGRRYPWAVGSAGPYPSQFPHPLG